ncbi:mitochondrial inner membrane protease ATP23 homolog [Nasonia vitripennis]|uniref:Mitochondrial inner membrane protease ATP23 n=1 Tax=Nasonia vitripennis TaxID=7425 RepID=A0A7M7H2E5_NASVI|nr:mitochondrial inner membrane protease ATP23 homolog [Nasonia vitripennis]XP_032458143.1 mitochondrial inner membrane protease ATP23 homolog [Nasonia vitripennis]
MNNDNKNDSESNPVKTGVDWEYSDLYPERRGNKHEKSWFRTMLGLDGKEDLDKIKCERNVYWCLRNSPLVKIMLGALKSSGCEFDFRRHISCEVCDSKVSGGYDPVLNQVVICQNVAKRKGYVQSVLTHELIHMFDYCKNDLDFKNIYHLACTEVRAANLAHCSFLSAWTYGTASPRNIKERHKECVRQKALTSVLALKNVTKDEALEAINKVFPKCYDDLEPIGRRCRRNSPEFNLALTEAPLYGYEYRI